MRSRWACSAAIVALLIGSAAAQTTEQLATSINDGKFGEAYDLAGQLVAANGDDADVRYWASVACLRTARFDEAERHLAAGLAKHPDDPHLLGLHAQILLAQGDEDQARKEAERGAAIDPTAPDAATALDEIQLGDRARARLGGEDPGLPAGSAQAFVDGVIARIADGAKPIEIARDFDLELIANAPPDLRTHQTLVDAIGGALGEARRLRDEAGQRFYGWVTAAETTASGDRTIVDVLVPAETTLTEKQVAAIGAAAADPELRGTVDPEMLQRIEGVPEDQRPALLARMQGVHTRTVLDLHFEVAGAAGAYRITDLRVGGVSVKSQFGNFAKVMDKVDPPHHFQLTPWMIGVAGGAIGAIIALAFLLTRKRR